MAFSVGSIVGDLSLNVRQVERDFDKTKSSISLGTTFIGNFLANLATKVTTSVVSIVTGAASKIAGFLSDSSQEASKFEAAMVGLTNVGKKLALSQVELQEAVESLTRDGLLSVGEAAQGLKNLLSKGFGLEESVRLMNVFKDAAAFGRQAALSFGEAVVSATEGVKNENSILVDNAGITKNLSVILKEAGFAMQDLSDETNGAAARQALLNGLIKEGELFEGDAEAASESLAGAKSRLKTAMDRLKVTIGEQLNPQLEKVLNFLTPLVTSTSDWFAAHNPEITSALGRAMDDFLLPALERVLAVIISGPAQLKVFDLAIQEFVGRAKLQFDEIAFSFGTVGRFLNIFRDESFEEFKAAQTEVAEGIFDLEAKVESLSLQRQAAELDAAFAVEEAQKKIQEILGRTVEETAEVGRSVDEEIAQGFEEAAFIAKAEMDRARIEASDDLQAIATEAGGINEKVERLSGLLEVAAAGFGALPSGFLRAGSFIINQINVAGPVTGRDSVQHLIDEFDNRGDSNQGGGRGDGETPPPF